METVHQSKGDIYSATRTCPSCGAKSFRDVFGFSYGDLGLSLPEGFVAHLLECSCCAMLYISPFLKDIIVERIYRDNSNYELPQHDGIVSEDIRRQAARQFAYATEIFVGRKSVLDVGCAVGYTLSLYKKAGFEVQGIDGSKDVPSIADQLYGVPVLPSMLKRGIFSRRFGIVHMSHVLEHIYDVDSFLLAAADYLDDDGVLFVEVPSALDTPKNHQEPYHIFYHEHVNFFVPETLETSMSRLGFEKLRLDVFSNEDGTHPSYPVICSSWKMSPKRSKSISSDLHALRKKTRDYFDAQSILVAGVNRKLEPLKKLKGYRIALWGAGSHTAKLYSIDCLDGIAIQAIIDNNPKRAGNVMNGLPIIFPPKDILLLTKDFDAIVISSFGSQEEIYQQLKPLRERGMKIIRLYDSVSRLPGLQEHPA